MARPTRRNWAKAGYRSGFEQTIAEDLEKRGIEFRFESIHLKYRKRVNSGICDACGHGKVSQRRVYTPDFELHDGGATFYVESKGNFPPADRAKMLAVKASNPDLDIRLLFLRDNKLQKGKDERYSDWATKHGFTFSIGNSVPESWTKSTPPAQGSGVSGQVQPSTDDLVELPDGGGKPRVKRKRNNGKS